MGFGIRLPGPPWLWQAAIGLVFAAAMAKILAYLSWVFLFAAIVLWGLVLLCWAYAARRLPAAVQGNWLMQRLARVTDIDALMGMVQQQPLRRPIKIDIDAAALSAKLKERVIGQDAVCDDVANTLERNGARTGRKLPLGVFMFAGPPATGKTMFAETLAKSLPGFGTLMIPMSQYGQPHTVASLFGQAKGYRGAEKYGLLTGQLKSNPKTVVILDEFEKCDPSIHLNFLSAWNDGFITEVSTGERVSTISAVFVLTSNAEAEAIARLAVELGHNRDALAARCKETLKTSFSDAVLSRLHRIFAFAELDDQPFLVLAGELILDNFTEYELEVSSLDPQVILEIASTAREQGADARALRQVIDRMFAPLIRDFQRQNPGVKRLRIDDADGIIVLKVART